MIYREFLDAGYKIFGLRGIDKKGNCTCGDKKCIAQYKHPISSNWQHTPLWSDEQLEKMETEGRFKTGYGVLVAGSLLVVDVDARNGGVDAFEKLAPIVESCGFVVKTGSGNGSKHLYFKAPEGISLVTKHKDYKGIDFKSSGYVVGPGSLHISGDKYEVLYGDITDINDAPDELIKILKQPEYHRTESGGKILDIRDSDILEMLNAIDPCCDYDIWYRVGMAVHNATGGSGFNLWDEWSREGGKAYPGYDNIYKKWHSFGKGANSVTIGTLIYWARKYDWKPRGDFADSFNEFFISSGLDDVYDGLPCDVHSVDLLRPPGFVGEICDWINNQCRFKRESLAVAASLVTVGNVGGLRYIDDLTDATANLFAFCVAESSTGKESVMQATIDLHIAAKISGATHGSIKSEQEIIRNLVRNQSALYIIDEIGIFLEKIVNAQQRGGAAYLDGVIGELMKIYSKASGTLLLTGDLKEETIKKITDEIAKADNEGNDEELKALKDSLEIMKNGLQNPFLSLIGFTTGITFKGLCTMKQAQSGFIGRALLINQLDSNPKPKKKFKKVKMPIGMSMQLRSLYSHGESTGRVQYIGEREKIPTTEEAEVLMDKISDWLFYEYAELHKEINMEAVVRRGYELMSKISLILAIPGGLRDVEHVVWSFAMMKRDIDEKVRMVYITSESGDNSLRQRIMGIISVEHPENFSVIANKCRPSKKEDVLKELTNMEKDGKVKCENFPHGRSKTKTVEKWIAL